MKIAIVGAGFSGIAIAAELQRAGHEDFVILERGDDVGGVWRENHYPGAACDVPSYLYSFSWAQQKTWSSPCSPQAEILQYLRDVCQRRGLDRHLRLGTEVTSADWDEATHQWTVGLDGEEPLVVDALVLGCGQLSRPAWPSIPGLDTFEGEAFHSAQWNHDLDLAGRRVAVIGTGASAIQFVPPVAETAAHLDVYQRTAPYLLPRRNPRYPAAVKAAIRLIPGLQTARRLLMWGVMEAFIVGLSGSRPVEWALRTWSTSFMKLQVRDPQLRRQIWPDYAFGCKRILFSSSYLKTLARTDVELVTEPIERVTPSGVVCGGVERSVDTIIYGTGFRAGEFVTPIEVRGDDGTELQEAWSEAPSAYRGIAVHGFPNLFLMYGPNTNLGVGSVVAMLEAQAGYITRAVAELERSPGAAIAVRPEVQAEADDRIQERFAGTAWTQCTSWYRQDGTGRVIGNWPGSMREYVRSLSSFDREHYTLVPLAGAVRAASATSNDGASA